MRTLYQVLRATDAEIVTDRPVTGDVLLHQIGEHPLPLSDQVQQGTSTGMVFVVCFQVIRKTGDPVGEQGYLAFDRTGVAGTTAILCENLVLFFFTQVNTHWM